MLQKLTGPTQPLASGLGAAQPDSSNPAVAAANA